MPADTPPPEIVELADARAAARRARDWTTADALRARIEAAGWKVIDAGTLYDLERAAAPDEERDGVIRHGSSTSVPSRLDAAPVGLASVVIVADASAPIAETMRALVGHAPDGTQVVVVANGDHRGDAGLDDLDAADPGAPGIVTELVRTRRLGHAAALNAGIRRAAAPVVIVLDPGAAVTGDVVTPLVRAMADESVAVAGPFGRLSADLRRFEDAPPDAREVDAIQLAMMAFRREDYAALGPLDEHFEDPVHLDTWWSLVLRDGDAADGEGGRTRRALVVPLPVERPGADPGVPHGERGRPERRNFYRVLKRFATRRDLLVRGG